MRLFTHGPDWIVALDADDALAIWVDLHGSDRLPIARRAGYRVAEVPPETMIKLEIEGRPMTKTAPEWARISERGILCSSEW